MSTQLESGPRTDAAKSSAPDKKPLSRRDLLRGHILGQKPDSDETQSGVSPGTASEFNSFSKILNTRVSRGTAIRTAAGVTAAGALAFFAKPVLSFLSAQRQEFHGQITEETQRDMLTNLEGTLHKIMRDEVRGDLFRDLADPSQKEVAARLLAQKRVVKGNVEVWNLNLDRKYNRIPVQIFLGEPGNKYHSIADLGCLNGCDPENSQETVPSSVKEQQDLAYQFFPIPGAPESVKWEVVKDSAGAPVGVSTNYNDSDGNDVTVKINYLLRAEQVAKAPAQPVSQAPSPK